MATAVTVLGKSMLSSKLFNKSSYLCKCFKYSTAASPVIEDPLARFRTFEERPSQHTLNHVGKYYRIDTSLKDKLFFAGGVPKLLDLQMKTFLECCIMVREPALEVISYVKGLDFTQPAVRFVLYGKNGTGKTTSLIHILHYAYESKFLLLHVPWVSQWSKRPKEVVPSQFKEGMYDLPIESTLWLQHFSLQNKELLEELDLRTTQSYTWSQREVTEKGEPLMAIVEHGTQRGRHASDCIAALLKEIKLLSKTNKFKTMVMIDGVNAFFCHTNVKKPDKSQIPCKDITICKAFMKMVKNDWNNAVIVTSADILPKNRHFTVRDAYTPHALLGKEGFELLDPFVPILVEQYSEKEIESAIDYYIDRLWINSEKAKSEAGRKQLKFLSGYNPLFLMNMVDPL